MGTYSKLNKKRVWLFSILLVMAVISFFGIRWATYTRPPLPDAVAALENDAQVAVTYQPWLTFTPLQNPPDTGFIFYPGGRIDPRGYASLMRVIANENYLVVVPKMPINMAAFNPNIAEEIMATYPDIEHWVISGHSVGGAMAAQYTYKHSEKIDGLAIWASYPPGYADLSGLELPVVLIYGSRETTVTDSSVAERQHLLPPDTVYVRIEGGDHHQFGSYLIQPEEDLATIERSSQHEQILEPTLKLLEAVAK
ncbi:MAG: alpha/beta hydrolase [Anaerolineae bacterium]|nr:alpha/beta hydrolase [Anaerolineae bacterium]